MTPLTKVCAWCGRHLGGPKPSNGAKVSHGICQACMEKYWKERNPDLLVLNPRGSKQAVEELWRQFHFAEPATYYEVPDADVPKRPRALMVIGRLESLVYRIPDESEKGGLLYAHDFSDQGDGVEETEEVYDGSRPLLCADAEGRLHIVGGAYSVTDRGIVG